MMRRTTMPPKVTTLVVALGGMVVTGCARSEDPGYTELTGGGGSDAAGGATSSVTTSAATTTTSGAGGSISSGEGNTVPYPDPTWATGDPADHGLDAAQLEAAAEVAKGLESHCLLVIRDGVLVFENYWNGHDEQTPQTSWSIAKSYAAVLVGIAIERSDMQSLDQSIADFLPDFVGTDHEAITLRHLLSMTSGLHWSAFDDYVGMTVFSNDHSEHAEGLALDETPGDTWTYHNGAVQLLEPIFRAATGDTIEAYAQAHLWSKIGSEASWANDPAGNPTAYASVLASCRDHARLGYLYLHGGQWAGEQVVPSTFVTESLTPSQPHNRAYGYLWWLNEETPAINAMMESWPGRMVPFAPPDLFAARGFGNQFIDVIPSLDMIVVRFGSDPMATFDIGELMNDQRFEKHDVILAPILDAVVD